MANELMEQGATGVPAWMKAASTGAKIGNIDSSDLKPPRLKVLAGQSPEVMNGVPGATPGKFWMTIIEKNLGDTVKGSLVLLKKSYQLWAPRVAGGDSNGPLATASDGINWDEPNQEWEVKFPANQGGGSEIWKIGKSVIADGYHKFGSSRKGDPKSKPAATLTYDMLWAIDVDDKPMLCVFTAARTGVKPTQNFVSQCMSMGIDHYFQRYSMAVQKKTNNQTGDPYFTFDYRYLGLVQSEEQGAAMKALFEQYSKSGFVADLQNEADEIQDTRNPTGGKYQAAREEMADDDIPF